jgi:tetratricopeptide (TPR) repeat protein
MFSSRDYDNNKAYRTEQEARAANARLAQVEQTKQAKRLTHYIRNTNIGSTALFIISIAVLLIFFSFSAAAAQAQDGDMFAPGAGGGSIEMFYLTIAVDSAQDGDLDKARFYFDEALAINSEFAPAYTGRGYISLLNGDYYVALADALMALELNPADGAVYYVLGEINFALENYSDARFHYEAYQLWVEVFEKEPILISLMTDEDSMELLNEHLSLSIANIAQEAAS